VAVALGQRLALLVWATVCCQCVRRPVWKPGFARLHPDPLARYPGPFSREKCLGFGVAFPARDEPSITAEQPAQKLRTKVMTRGALCVTVPSKTTRIATPRGFDGRGEQHQSRHR
jgi:hypothetical protein